LESSYALLLESAKKFANLQKIEFVFAKSSIYSKKVCKKESPKNDNIYRFEKPLTMPFPIWKNICNLLNNLMCN